MANRVEPAIHLRRIKVDGSLGRTAHAVEKNGQRMLLGESSLYAEILKKSRIVIFHEVQRVEITSSRGNVQVKERKKNPEWKTITLRPNEEVTFTISESAAWSAKNRVQVITAS